jgi:hypothetical protein
LCSTTVVAAARYRVPMCGRRRSSRIVGTRLLHLRHIFLRRLSVGMALELLPQLTHRQLIIRVCDRRAASTRPSRRPKLLTAAHWAGSCGLLAYCCRRPCLDRTRRISRCGCHRKCSCHLQPPLVLRNRLARVDELLRRLPAIFIGVITFPSHKILRATERSFPLAQHGLAFVYWPPIACPLIACSCYRCRR